jgi:biopolymer transport protein ExbD
MKFRRKKRIVPEISMTSMVDVVLLLLFFFMVSTTFNRQTQIKVTLPQASGADAQTTDNSVTLTIDAAGVYHLEDSAGELHALINQKRDTLVQALQKRGAAAQQLPLIIDADNQTPHQAVITALDAATVAGFSHISFRNEDNQAAE